MAPLRGCPFGPVAATPEVLGYCNLFYGNQLHINLL
jgi:hypothetical protein